MNEKIEKAIKPIVKMYADIETELLLIIANHFKYDDEFYNSDYWRIKKLEEMGLFNQEVVKFISKYSNKPLSKVKKTLNEISINIINQGNLEKLFKEGKININPKTLKKNYTIQNITNYAYSDLSNRLIQMSDKIEKSVKNAYLNIVESAYLKTSMGTHSYQEAIRSAIDSLGNKGIQVLTYKTTDEDGNIVGIRNYDIESAVRREVLTASRQLSGNTSIEVANQLQCEYVYLSEHLRCRPSHFDWQGTVIKREDLEKITHYGEVDGLYGINCAHYVEPYFGDSRGNELKKFTKAECKEAYDLSQRQRYLERGIRKWKRKEEMFKANGDELAYSKSHDKTLEWQKRIQDFTNENNLRRDFSREYVSENIKNTENLASNQKSEFNKVIFKEYLKNISESDYFEVIKKFEDDIFNQSIENAIIIEENGDVYKFTGVEDYVNIDGNFKNAIITHNHVTFKDELGGSFSKDDFNLLVKHQDIKELRAVDEKYLYRVKVLTKISENDYDNAYINVTSIDDNDYKHLVMKVLNEKGLIKYERTIRK